MTRTKQSILHRALCILHCAFCIALAAPAARAVVLIGDYMTISGPNQTSGVRLLTDYVPQSNTVVRAKFASASAAGSGNNQLLFCSRNGAGAANQFTFFANATGLFRFDYNGTQNKGSAFAANHDYELEVRNGVACVTDAASGVAVSTMGTGLQSYTPQYKMAFFQSYSDGGTYATWDNSFHGRFYYLELYEIQNGVETLVHRFVPCLEDGVAKLCDTADANATYALTVTGSGDVVVGFSPHEEPPVLTHPDAAVYTRHLGLSVAAGKIPAGVTVENLPVLVRLSEEIDGFLYSDFELANGGDMMFTDAAGNVLPHEVETWDEDGESLVWVRLSAASAGAAFTCNYGNGIESGIPQTDAWSDYGGVWHFDEASGTAFDSTANGFDGTPTGYWADELVATDGVIGKARYQPTHSKNTTREEGNRGYMAIPSLRSLGYGDTFAVSMWAKINTSAWGGLSPRLFNRTGGWIAQFPANNTSKLTLYGAAMSKYVQPVVPNLSTAWGHVTLVYSGATVSCYTNGHLSATGAINAAADSDNVLGIGWEPRWAEGYGDLACRYDELRISGSVPSADRVAAEYAAMADEGFIVCGTVAATAAAPNCAAPTVASDGNGGFTATVSLLKGAGTVELLLVSPQGATNVVALSNGAASAPATFTAPLSGLVADTSYTLVARATGAGATSHIAGDSFYNGAVSIAATFDADLPAQGIFTVSRGTSASAVARPLTVSYSASGTAVAGTHYEALPGTVTIPAGESSALIIVNPEAKVTGTTSLTLALAGGNYLVGNPASATITITAVRDPAALIWAAGTSATELNDPAHWTPLVPAIEENDTLSFTGDDTSAYRFTATNDLTVKSFAFANGASPAVVDLGGHTLSNYMADTTGSFKQTGTGPLVLQNGTLAARAFSFGTQTLALTNIFLCGNIEWGATSLTFNKDNANYLFDNVQLGLCYTYYGQLTFKGNNYVIDARNLVKDYPTWQQYVPTTTISGNNVTARFHGEETLIRASLSLSGNDIKVTVSEGRIYRDGASSYGYLAMSGTNLEFVVTNTTGSACVSRHFASGLADATHCAIRVLKGGKHSISLTDGLSPDVIYSFEGSSNLIEVADGTLTPLTLRIGYLDGANRGAGGNELAVRGDEAVVSFANGCYVGNTNRAPVTLSFAPGPAGFGGNAPVRQTGSGKYIRIATNTVFKVDGRALTRTRDHGRIALPLISFRSNANAETAFDAAALAAFNARLVSKPAGGKLTLETDGNYRILTWNYAKSGTVLMLR